ncbi:MAG: rhomboid family intramembrane serine protease [Clostridiales bacterium]|jgi:hypothetical protein|nr:rhomboid family intramembrane serine protease [Clostridiales bacterium]
MYNNNWIAKLNRKFGRYAVSNLILYIVIGQAVVFGLDFILSPTDLNLWSLLYFDRGAIARGQIWRLISFVFLPPGGSLLFAVLGMYFTWLIGSSLENEWGSFKFNIFFLTGVIGTMLAGLLTNYATNQYLSLSMFLAFASIFPDFQILLFFVIPIKVKYLALLDAVILIYSLVVEGWGGRLAILISILNLLLYFGPQAGQQIRLWYRRSQWKRKFR